MSRSLSPRRVKSDTEAFDTPTKRNSKKDDAILTPKSVKNAVKEKVTPGKDKDIKDKETVLTPSFIEALTNSLNHSLSNYLLTCFFIDIDTSSKVYYCINTTAI